MSTTILALMFMAFAGDEPGSAEVLAPGAKLEKLWGEGSFTEGGALAEDGSILFSDIGDRIMRFDPKTKAVTVFREPSGRANGLIFDPKGRLIAAEGANTGGGRRVSITERDGTVRTLADRYQGKRFNSPNDVAVDAAGRVYVSDPRYVGDEPRELDFDGVYRIDPDGTVHRLETTATKPNGLAVSPDGKTLYVADNGPARRALLALDLDADGSRLRPARPARLRRRPGHRRHDRDGRRPDRRRRRRGSPGGRLCLLPRRQAARLHPRPRVPDQRRVRRPRPQDPLHHRRQEPLPGRDHDDRPPPLAVTTVRCGP